jgi:hypothetical protein
MNQRLKERDQSRWEEGSEDAHLGVAAELALKRVHEITSRPFYIYTKYKQRA